MFLKEDGVLKGELRQLIASRGETHEVSTEGGRQHHRSHRAPNGALNMDEGKWHRRPHTSRGARGVDGDDDQQLRVYPYSRSLRR